MTDQQKATYALAALIVLCATLLGALRVLGPTLVMAAYGLAANGVAWYHVLAPGQGSGSGASSPMPPPAEGAT